MMAEPEPVYLRRVGEAIRFLCGTQSLDVSSELAGRCGLLAEILDDTDDNDGTVVPYSIDAIAAWKEFAEQEAGQASHLDYGVTVRALKAADFLRDEVTMARLAESVSKAFVPTTVSASPLRDWRLHLPTEEQRERVKEVLAAAAPVPDDPGHLPHGRPHALRASLVHLLLLLPPSLHPTALSARCPSLSRGALFLLAMPHHDSLDSATPQRACFTVQALAAVLALSGGNPGRIRATPAQNSTQPSASSSATAAEESRSDRAQVNLLSLEPLPLHIFDTVGKKRSHASISASTPQVHAAAAPSGTAGVNIARNPPQLTSLILELMHPEPPLWGPAVAQLQSLHDVQLRFLDLAHSDGDTVLRTLRGLPALRRLGLYGVRAPFMTTDRLTSYAEYSVSYTPKLILKTKFVIAELVTLTTEQGAMATLLATDGIYALTGLKALRLDGLMHMPGTALLKGVTRLTALTYLAIPRNVFCERRVVAHALAAQTLADRLHCLKLQTVDVSYTTPGLPLVVELAGQQGWPQLRALRALGRHSLLTDWDVVIDTVGHFQLLTELQLSRSSLADAANPGSLKDLLRSAPQLRCFTLHGCRPSEMGAIAEMLPEMLSLTSLDLRHADVTLDEMEPVVHAANALHARGSGRGLKCIKMPSIQAPARGGNTRLREVLGKLQGVDEVCVDYGLEAYAGRSAVLNVTKLALDLRGLANVHSLGFDGAPPAGTLAPSKNADRRRRYDSMANGVARARMPELREVRVWSVPPDDVEHVRGVFAQRLPGISLAVEVSMSRWVEVSQMRPLNGLAQMLMGEEMFKVDGSGQDYFSGWD